MSYIEELTRRRLELLKELEAIDVILQMSNARVESKINTNSQVTTPGQKDLTDELKKASQPEQFLIILKETQRFMKIREIAKMLVNIIGGDEDDWTTKLSRITGKLKKLGKITSYKVGKANTNVFWGSPSWISSGGEIIEKHLYDKSALEKTGSLPNL